MGYFGSFGRLRFLSVLVGFVLLAGCKEVLYSNIEEHEANKMVAELAAAGVTATRSRDKDGIYEVLVEQADVPAATLILEKANLPSEKFASFGDVFASGGVVSTPFEQQARFIHALNQELSRTLTEIDNIRSARVLITAPPQGRYDRKPPPATASVTISYPLGVDISGHIPNIKAIVAHSVPNLDYDDVVVAMFGAAEPQTVSPAQKSKMSVNASQVVSAISLHSFLLVLGLLCLGLVVVYFRSDFFAKKRR